MRLFSLPQIISSLLSSHFLFPKSFLLFSVHRRYSSADLLPSCSHPSLPQIVLAVAVKGDGHPTISGEKGQYTLIVACHALFMAH
uniref:Uncharacterized protein n=1 Tax=Salix viminalis TaxID=40686 RepID=A0A6N2NG30_SALVM